MEAFVVARMFDCRCPGDCALQMRCGCFDSGLAYTSGFPAGIGVLHNARWTCCCQIIPFTARLRWHKPALFTLGHYGCRCPIFETVDCYRYAPPCPAIAIRCLAHLQTLTAIVQARDRRDCSYQAGCMHRAFPPTHKHTQRGAVRGKDERAQQHQHPTTIFGGADQAHHLNMQLRGLEVPH